MSGFYLMHRDWQDNSVFGNEEYSSRDAWVWLVENAAWKPTRVRVKGDTIDLDRGELCFAQRFMAEKWGWSKSRVDRFLKRLCAENMISIRSKSGATAGQGSGQGQSILTVCNYAEYQDVGEGQRGNEKPQSGATAGQQRGKEEQGNKGTRKEEKQDKPVSIAHALSDGWEPASFGPETQSRAIVDGWPPGDLQIQLEHFRAHHRAKGSKFKKWQEAWSTWVLGSIKFQGRHNGHANSNRPDEIRDPVVRAVVRREAQRLARQEGELFGDAGNRPEERGSIAGLR